MQKKKQKNRRSVIHRQDDTERGKMKKKNLAMGWIDYQKAFDMLPHSRIRDCLYLLGLNKKLITFLQSTMKNWRVELTCNNENLGEVETERNIPRLIISTFVCHSPHSSNTDTESYKTLLQLCK